MQKSKLFISLCLSIFVSLNAFASRPGDGGLELIDFTVVPNLNKVDIKWSTSAIKTGGPYFCVEKSKDGINYTKVVDMPAIEGAYSYSDYFETDYQPYPGVSYYRIKQVDGAGNFRYSQVVTLKISEEKKTEEYQVMSNNSESALKEINVEDYETLVILRDKNGNDIYSKAKVNSSKNKKAIKLSSNVTPGTYQLIGASDKKLNSQSVSVK